MTDFLVLANTCKLQRFTVNTLRLPTKLAERYIITGTNQTADRLLVLMHHENIHELASFRFLNLNLEQQNIKMGRKTQIYFFYETMFQITIMRSDTTVVSIESVLFNICSYYNSYTWSKNIPLTIKYRYTVSYVKLQF